MVFFGVREKEIARGNADSQTCQSCSKKNTLNYFVLGKYFHVYWIPTIPLGKRVVSVCDSCKATTEDKEMHEIAKPDAERIKKTAKYPLKYFSGLLVIGLLVLGGIVFNLQNSSNEKEYLMNPAVGDVYILKSENKDGFYTYYKITDIAGDVVDFDVNQYEYSRKYGNDIEDSDYFDFDVSFTKQELEKKYYNSKEIVDISR